MKLKKLALRVGEMVVLASMLGGCIVVPHGRGGGGYRHYSESDRGDRGDRGDWQRGGDRRDDHRH
jgi:hypothetical protein